VFAFAALPACTGLEPAAVSAGTSVAQTGVTILDRGKARVVEMVSYDEALAAVYGAADKLSLTQTRCDPTKMRQCLAFVDDRGDHLTIVIEGHTRSMTMIQADAGTFGEVLIASLFVKQVQVQLHPESK